MSRDEFWMRRALRLAARGFAPPNPMVGCVIVKDDNLVGEGYHPFAGKPHAEVYALEAAGDRASGATAYVTLEPCCHWGRTPPCTNALILAGVARVVVALLDPNPKVSGNGIAQLKQVGIRVDVGMLESEAKRLNAAFVTFHTTHQPYTTIKMAMTLDGKSATASGDSQWISGARSRRYVHKLRAQSGAVMVGVGTVLADNPRLTARLSPIPPRQPVRVIVDSRLRTPPASLAVELASSDRPLLIAATAHADAKARSRLERDGLEILTLPQRDGKVDLSALMRALADREIISVLVEGGGSLNDALLAAGLVHAVKFFIAPKLLGGAHSHTAVDGAGVAAMAQAIPLKDVRIRRFGPDCLYEALIDRPSDSNVGD